MKIRLALVSAVLLLALTGCTGTPGSSTAERTAPAAAESTEPLAAETPAETAAPEVSDTDTKFLAYVRDNLLPETQIPDATDEQLIAAGHDACEQLQSGVAFEDVRVVEGEQPHANGNFYDSSAVMGGAITAYCPEFL